MAFTGTIGTAFVDLKMNTKQYDAGVNKVKSNLSGLSKSSGSAFAGMLKTGLYVAAAAAAVKSISSVVKAFNAEEESVSKLNAVLKATGNAAGFTSKEMQDYSNELQSLTTFSNDAITNTQALLATFVEIKGVNFKDATKMALEMSAAFGQDLKSSAVQLGKALNDPIKGMGALSRVGVSFSKSQIEIIKGMVEMGNTAGAQTMMLKIMKEQGLDGVAESMRKTLPGAIKGLVNDLQDMGKTIMKAFGGEGIASVINGFSDKIQIAIKWVKDITNSKPWYDFLATVKFVMKDMWLRIKTPFVLTIALFKDVYNAIKEFIVKPMVDLLPMLAKFSDGMAGFIQKIADKFADKLPDGMANTKKAIKDLAAENKSNHEEWINSLAKTEYGVENVTKALGGAAAAQENLNEKQKVSVSGSEDMIRLAQQAADESKSSSMGAVAAKFGNVLNGRNIDVSPITSSSISIPQSVTSAASDNTGITRSVLENILEAIKSGNKSLDKIEKNTSEFSVFATA